MSPEATRFLGTVEILAALSVAAGIYIQIGAVLLIGIMLGAIYKKTMVWGTGFYSDEGYGWHYDVLLLCANLVFLATGGSFVLAGPSMFCSVSDIRQHRSSVAQINQQTPEPLTETLTFMKQANEQKFQERSFKSNTTVQIK